MKFKTHLYLTENELSVIFGVTKNAIWNWIRIGQFPPPVRLGKQWVRWRVADVNAWEEEIASDPRRYGATNAKVKYRKFKDAVLKQKTQELEEVI